jgi:[ribosomal protein S18]-alanine N-acetyltransferase
MTNFVSRLIAGAAPAIATARPSDAAAIAQLHGESFKRGWDEDEIYRLLIDANVIGHKAGLRGSMAGFILSRRAIDEAEILSIAIAPARRGRGLSHALLDRHLRTLAGLGVRAVFLEVDEHNAPARGLYDKAGFHEVGRRHGYYDSETSALVLRRNLG